MREGQADLFREVWVFNGVGGKFPAGVFSNLERAEAWIAKHRLSGTATLYTVDVGAYDWSIENGWFEPKKPHHLEPDFIGRFAGGQQHHHYEDDSVRLNTVRPSNVEVSIIGRFSDVHRDPQPRSLELPP
jgi:hypothetical protein